MTSRQVEWAWTCHFCKSHTMGVFIEQCPNPDCRHGRCSDCICEAAKTRQRKVDPRSVSPKTAPTQTAQMYKEKEILTNSPPDPHLPAFRTGDCRISEQHSTAIPIRCMNWRSDKDEIGLTPSEFNSLPVTKNSKSAISPTSLASLSPTSTRTNGLLEGTPSTFKSPDTEVDDNGNESSLEESDVEYDEDIEDRTIRILERHVFSVLDNDLELAAKLLPQIYHCYMDGLDMRGVVFAKTPSHETSNPSESYRSPRKGTIAKALQCPTANSTLPKRRRLLEGDGNHDDNDEGEDRVHKRPKLNIGNKQLRGFACPFYKKNSDFYDVYEDPRYQKCRGPGPEDFRHLKDHMIAAHGPRQCDKCFVVFMNSKEQLAHRKTDLCRQQQEGHREHLAEDISNELWIRIECLFSTRGRSRMLPHSQTQHSIEKWFEMWRFLFGDLPQPAHPYNEDPRFHKTPSSYRTYSLTTMLGDNFEHLLLDEDVGQHYLVATDTILGTNRADPASFDWSSQALLDPPITWPSQTSNESFPGPAIGMTPGARNAVTNFGLVVDPEAHSSEIGVIDNLPNLHDTTRSPEVDPASNTRVHSTRPTDHSLISMLPAEIERTSIGYADLFSDATVAGIEDHPSANDFLEGLNFEQFHQDMPEFTNVDFSADRMESHAEHGTMNDDAPSSAIDNLDPDGNEIIASMLGIEEELRVEGATSSWGGKNRRNTALKGKSGDFSRVEEG